MKQLNDFLPQDLQVSIPERSLHHQFEEADCHALWAAHAAGRPLLVRGKPGAGKSQMARAIAEQLGWACVEAVISGGTELDDLHWHFDAIGRLGEAQARSMPGGAPSQPEDQPETTSKPLDPLDPLRFLSPGAFWWAYDWASAKAQHRRCQAPREPKIRLPRSNPDWNETKDGVVLLLDEMDKAEPDLPNGLLETLGDYAFTVPHLRREERDAAVQNRIEADPERLLVIVTTNEERELPQAFVRRCFVHTLKMGGDADWFIQRGKLHFGDDIDERVYAKAAGMLLDDRHNNPHGLYPPGLAEYIDLLRVVVRVPKAGQYPRLLDIAAYALEKERKDEDH